MRLSRLLVTLITAAAALAPRAASGDDSQGSQPVAYTMRPLTLPSLTLSPDIGVTLDELSTKTIQSLPGTVMKNPKNLHLSGGIGFRFGIVDAVEVGGGFGTVQLLPTVSWGDPNVYGTFRFLKGSFEIAGTINTTFITHGSDNPQLYLPVLNSSAGVLLEPGLLTRIHMGEKAKLDIGGIVPIQLGDKAKDIGLKVPVEVAFTLTQSFHLGGRGGFGIVNFKDPKLSSSYIPLGLITGYAIEGAKGPIVDIDANFTWPKFVTPGDTSKFDVVDFQVGLTVAVYIYLI